MRKPGIRAILEEAMDIQSGIFKIEVKEVADLSSGWTNSKLAHFLKFGRVMTLIVSKSFLDVPGNEKKLENELFDYLARSGGNEIFKQEYDDETECYFITVRRV